MTHKTQAAVHAANNGIINRTQPVIIFQFISIVIVKIVIVTVSRKAVLSQIR